MSKRKSKKSGAEVERPGSGLGWNRDRVSRFEVALIREAFDFDALARVCAMHETEFAEQYGMEVTLAPESSRWPSWDEAADYPDFYAFRDNGAQILAVAHLDTVMPHAERAASFVDTAAGPVVFSGALDDRLGAYTILELLPRLGIGVDVLLTTGEEQGNSTAQHFAADKEYLWAIEFDRGGTDVVMYQYHDAETEDLVRDCGARVGHGSFSDIAYLDHLEVKAFNWGVGYRDYHGPRSHAFLEDYWQMLAYFVRFHDANADVYLPHELRRFERRSSWGSGLWGDAGRDAGGRWAIAGREGADALDFDDEDPDGPDMVDGVVDGELVSEDFAVVNERLLAGRTEQP